LEDERQTPETIGVGSKLASQNSGTDVRDLRITDAIIFGQLPKLTKALGRMTN